MQDPAFAAALRRLGQSPLDLPGGTLLLRRRIAGVPVLMLPRAMPPADLFENLRVLGLQRHPLILSPEHPCRLPPSFCLARPRRRLVAPLDRDPAIRRARLHPKWRNQLKRAESTGTEVVKRPPDSRTLARITRNETLQAAARRYRGWPAALTCAFAQVAPDQTHVFEARFRGRCIAHMLFLSHGTAATYHIGHITDEGRGLRAHNLLMWAAMGHLATMGCHSIDLGLMQDGAPGLDRFKRRTGADWHSTGGTFLVWRPFARS